MKLFLGNIYMKKKKINISFPTMAAGGIKLRTRPLSPFIIICNRCYWSCLGILWDLRWGLFLPKTIMLINSCFGDLRPAWSSLVCPAPLTLAGPQQSFSARQSAGEKSRWTDGSLGFWRETSGDFISLGHWYIKQKEKQKSTDNSFPTGTDASQNSKQNCLSEPFTCRKASNNMYVQHGQNTYVEKAKAFQCLTYAILSFSYWYCNSCSKL